MSSDLHIQAIVFVLVLVFFCATAALVPCYVLALNFPAEASSNIFVFPYCHVIMNMESNQWKN